MLGGWGESKEADSEVQGHIDSLKNDIQTKTGKTYNTLAAKKYHTQVVNGLKYKVKVQADDGSHLHVHYHKAAGTGNLTLGDVHEGKHHDEPL